MTYTSFGPLPPSEQTFLSAKKQFWSKTHHLYLHFGTKKDTSLITYPSSVCFVLCGNEKHGWSLCPLTISQMGKSLKCCCYKVEEWNIFHFTILFLNLGHFSSCTALQTEFICSRDQKGRLLSCEDIYTWCYFRKLHKELSIIGFVRLQQPLVKGIFPGVSSFLRPNWQYCLHVEYRIGLHLANTPWNRVILNQEAEIFQ